MKMLTRISKLIIGLTMGFVALNAFALPSDNDKKIILSADTAEINRLTGIGIYTGSVQVDQGTTHVTGDTMTTHNDEDNKLKEIIIESHKENLAHYKTLLEEGKPPLEADANTITFHPQDHLIILTGHASINQGTDSIQGEQLIYNTEKKLLLSDNKKKSGRTTIIIEQTH